MAYTRIAVGSAQGTGQTNAISVTGLDTLSTPANIIFACVAAYGGSPNMVAADLADSQTNSYTLLPIEGAGGDPNLNVGIYYKISPTNSAALSVTFTPAAGGYPSMVVYAFSQGSAPTFNTHVETGTNTAGQVTPGSIGNANDLVIEALAFYGAGLSGNTLSGGFSSPVDEIAYLAANAMGLSVAWKEITGAVNPSWTTNAANIVAAQAAAVTGTGGGPAVGRPFSTRIGGRRF